MNHKPSQFCGPPNVRGRHTLNAPLPQSATLSDVCEWTHCVRMSGLSAEEPGSSPPNETPRLGTALHHPSYQSVGGDRSPAERVACARKWTDELCCVCLAACVTGQYAVLGENACRDGEVKTKIYKSTSEI